MLTIPQNKIIFKGFIRMKMSEFLQIDPYMIKYQPLTDLQEENGNKFNVVVLENDGYTIENNMRSWITTLPISLELINLIIILVIRLYNGWKVIMLTTNTYFEEKLFGRESNLSSFTFEKKDTVIELLI